MFSYTRLALTAHRSSSLRLLSSQQTLLYTSPSLASSPSLFTHQHRSSSPLLAHGIPSSSSSSLLLSQGSARQMGFFKELQKSLSEEIAKEKKVVEEELEKEREERGEKVEKEEGKEGGNEEGGKDVPKEQGPSFQEQLNETLQSSKEKFNEFLTQARQKADTAKQDLTQKYEAYRAPPPETSASEPPKPEPESPSSSSENVENEQQKNQETAQAKSTFDEWKEYLSQSGEGAQQNEHVKKVKEQYEASKEWSKSITAQFNSYFQKGVEEKDKALEAAKEQIKDSTFTKNLESAKEAAKKTTQDTSSVVTDFLSQKKDEITTTIGDSEVGQQTVKAKETVEKFIFDPQPEARPEHQGPIRPDEEMKSMVEKEEALWRKQVRDLKGKMENTAAYKAVSDAKIAIEDSDNPLVQRSLDVVDTVSIKAGQVSSMVLGSSEEAQVLSAIDQYLPGFIIEEFLQKIVEHEGMVYTFLKAVTARDQIVLQKMCTELNLKRHDLIAEKTADEIPPGTTPNLVITWIDLPELMQLTFHEATDNPQILINFNVQCYEEYLDADGNSELPESIKSVKYLWLLQFDPERGWLVHEDAVGAREAIW